MARDPTRIKKITEALYAKWAEHPTLRLGQLISNCLTSIRLDIYYIEDDIMLNAINAYPQNVVPGPPEKKHNEAVCNTCGELGQIATWPDSEYDSIKKTYPSWAGCLHCKCSESKKVHATHQPDQAAVYAAIKHYVAPECRKR